MIYLLKLQIDLAGDASAKGLFGSGDGAVNAKLKGNKGTLTLKGTEATFTAFNELVGDIGLNFETMTIGSGSAMDLKGGLDLTARSALNIDGGKEKGALTVTSGSVTLDGASGSVAAKTITLNGAGENAKFNVNGGVWEVQSLVQTQGTSKVTSGSTLNVKGDLTLTAGTMTVDNKSTLNIAGKLETTGAAGKLIADSSVVNTISGGTVTLADKGLELKNTAELKLESKDFATSDAFDHTKVIKGSIAGDTTTVVSFDDGALKISEAKFKELVNQLGDTFKGTIKVDLTDVKPLGPDSTLDDVAK